MNFKMLMREYLINTDKNYLQATDKASDFINILRVCLQNLKEAIFQVCKMKRKEAREKVKSI